MLSSLRKTLLSEWTADEMVEGFATDADDTGHLEEEVEEVAVEAGSLEESDQVGGFRKLGTRVP